MSKPKYIADLQKQMAVNGEKIDNITKVLDGHVQESITVRDDTVTNTAKTGFLMRGFWIIATAVIGLIGTLAVVIIKLI